MCNRISGAQANAAVLHALMRRRAAVEGLDLANGGPDPMACG